jgi:hypothetical protein
MWDQLTPMDLQRARDRLAALRTVTLNRHVEEVKRLDIEQAEIETQQPRRNRPPRANLPSLLWPIKTPASQPVRKYLGRRLLQTSRFIITRRQILARLLAFADLYNDNLGIVAAIAACLAFSD